MTFRQLSHFGKSVADLRSERAMGVVPRGLMVFRVFLILPMFLGPKPTSSLVSLQSCGGEGFW
ncbi:MAG: Uncharacterised protein [Flavobacteriia bacterium]|nr:MAG: Uncharacterised protein [Flavobacteriia bacterium]